MFTYEFVLSEFRKALSRDDLETADRMRTAASKIKWKHPVKGVEFNRGDRVIAIMVNELADYHRRAK